MWAMIWNSVERYFLCLELMMFEEMGLLWKGGMGLIGKEVGEVKLFAEDWVGGLDRGILLDLHKLFYVHPPASRRAEDAHTGGATAVLPVAVVPGRASPRRREHRLPRRNRRRGGGGVRHPRP